MLRLSSVTVQLGSQDILHDVHVEVNPSGRVAVVGRNGAGKTTLVRVLAGTLTPDGGERTLGRGEDVGMLEQERRASSERTVWQEVYAVVEPLLALQAKAEALLAEASGRAEEDSQGALELLNQAEALQERFRTADGFQAERNCGRVLSGMGFSSKDWHRSAAEFSGGWQIRLGIARLLMARPSYLLLDEPTNHLDLETRTWLLHELKAYPGGVVVISHDRDFLDRLARRTIEVSGGGVETYSGGYTAFLRQRAARIEQLKALASQQADERARLQLFIDRFRAKATKAKQVQSRIKQLERLPIIVVPPEARSVSLTLPPAPPSTDPMLTVAKVSRSFGELQVLDSANGEVHRGDRILLVGPNGAGKSTLLSLMAGQLKVDGGSIRPGPGASIGWFAQDHAANLNPDPTVLDAVASADPLKPIQQVRSMLGAFLFDGEGVKKPCGVLSGGEKSRVVLARLLLSRANLLLLDEPTNHLDIETKDILLKALVSYEGAIVFVSHDRQFANALATAVWEVGGGTVSSHWGDLDDFLWNRAIANGLVARRAPGESAPDSWLLGGLPPRQDEDGVIAKGAPRLSGEAVGSTGEDGAASSWRERKRKKSEGARVERELEVLQERIGELEELLQSIDTEMSDPEVAANWDALAPLQEQRTEVESQISTAYERWEELEDGSS